MKAINPITKVIYTFLFLLPIFVIALPVFSTEKTQIAIIDFHAQNVSKQNAIKVTELIRNEMINSGKFIIIERAQMGAVLREQGFQQTGCTDVSCAVEIGKLLSARKILVGNVMKHGNGIIVTGRLVDVEKGVAEFSGKTISNKNDKVDLAIEKFCESLSDRIAGKTSHSFFRNNHDSRVSTSVYYNYLLPPGTLKDLVNPGNGVSADIKFRFIADLSIGIQSGYLSFSGKENMTEKLVIIPLLAHFNYSFNLLNNFSLNPYCSTGIGFNSLTEDSDGISAGEPTDYKTKSAIEPMFNVGLNFAYLLGSLDIKIGFGYAIIIEKDNNPDFLTFNAGLGVKF